MLKKLFMFCFVLLYLACLEAQTYPKYDYVWNVGSGCPTNQSDTTETNIVLDFNLNPPRINKICSDINYSQTNSSICDPQGNLFCFSDGLRVKNANRVTMVPGFNQVFDSDVADYYSGQLYQQSCLTLPYPDHPDLFILFNVDLSLGFVYPYAHHRNLEYLILDRSLNNGLGGVYQGVTKLIQNDSLDSKVAACRHANGRDWWIIVVRSSHPQYRMFLLTPYGIEDRGTQDIGRLTHVGDGGRGNITFSPDGNRMAHTNSYENTHSLYKATLLDFDRCSGILSNPREDLQMPSGQGFGLFNSFSSNSRFLYINSAEQLYQYDLSNPDITSSLGHRVLIDTTDGYYNPTYNPVFKTHFGTPQLGPDNKIYISTYNDTQYFHVINNPDSAGTACNFQKHSLFTGCWNLSIPLFPNFRLGALQGSSCDTLLANATIPDPESGFAMYPNPASDQLHIDLQDSYTMNTTLNISDIQGRCVSSQVLDSQHSDISLSNIPAGVYLVCIKQENRATIAKKLVVVR